MVEDVLDADQLILQLAPQVRDLLLLLKVREDLIAEEEARFPSRYRTPQAAEVMELAEGPGKGGLAALVRTGDDEDALVLLQKEVVADDRFLHGHELAGQGDIVGVGRCHLLGAPRNIRVAEGQAGCAERCHGVQPGEVELDLAIEALDDGIEVAATALMVGTQLREDFGMQLRHEVEDARLDVVHIREVAEGDQIVLGDTAFESPEDLPHLGAVVGFAAVAVDPDTPAVNADRVPDFGELLLQLRRFGSGCAERVRPDVGGEVVAEPKETA